VRALYRRHARGNSLFRNRGDGTFEDVTEQSGTAMGRWAWSSDALDFDRDGWEDLYVVNGMFTRDPGEDDLDLDSFFWRQVTARSPLAAVRGTPFDDAWRATNRLLAGHASQARHERNVLLRNDGRGGFDEVAGAAGLDLDQDGRSFAVLDLEGDGDPDLAVMAARSAPQLRLFRNDLRTDNAALALRLTGRESNRDAVGARVTVTTDVLRRTRVLMAGSGFISQHSKELLFGLGTSRRVLDVEVLWPSGRRQATGPLPLDHRVWIEEGSDEVKSEAFSGTGFAPSRQGAAPAPPGSAGASEPTYSGTWLYRPYPAPDFTLRDLDGHERSLAGLSGRPALLLFWSAEVPAARQALLDLAGRGAAAAATGLQVLALAVDPPGEETREAARGVDLPVAHATPEAAGTYSVLSRYLFDRREELRLPTALLLDGRGEVVKVYRDRIDAGEVLADVPRIEAAPAERLARALPFAGTFHVPPGERSDFQYSLDLAEQGYDAPALAGFARAARLDPSAITFYNLGTLSMKTGRPADARSAFERALEMQPDYPEAANSLGALLAQSGDVAGAIARFRSALESRPDFPDALNNLGYALFQEGEDEQAHRLFLRALELQPGFPEAFNNLGILFGQQGDLDRAEGFFRQALEARPGYGEAGNNLALVLAARGDPGEAIELLKRLIEANPAFDMTYVTLSKVYLGAGRRREGIQVLEILLQRSPKHPIGREMLRQVQGGG